MASPLTTTGNAYVNDYKKQDKHPDFTGFLDISREQIQALIEQGKSGQEPKLALALWVYPSKRDPNERRFFITAEPKEKRSNKPKPKDDWGNTDVPF